jgi:hypothetical protein
MRKAYSNLYKFSFFNILKFALIFCFAFAGRSTVANEDIPDFNENENIVGCAWARDVPGAKFIKGKGTPRIALDIYFDKLGKNKIATLHNDRRAYRVVAKKNGFVKLTLQNMDEGQVTFGWAPFDQLFFGALRNCAVQSLQIEE